jgi:cell division control protein 6
LGSIIKTPEPLESSFIPDKLFNRQQEITKINESVLLPVREGVASNIFIYGQSGAGKTVTLKYISSSASDIHIHYENAISVGSFKRICTKLVNSLGHQIPDNLPMDVVFKSLKKYSTKPIVLIVDECLNLVRTDPDGLYNIVRSAELYDIHMGIIMVSVDNPALHMTSRDIRKLGIFTEIKFLKYSKEDLYNILFHRSQVSLYESAVDHVLLESIADIAKKSGSARMAIEILQKSAFMAEYGGQKNISLENVRSASSMISPYITESKLMELDVRELLVLLSLCQLLDNMRDVNLDLIIPQINVNFESRSMDIPELSFIYRSLRHLESLDIIESAKESDGKGAGVKKRFFMNETPVNVMIQKIYDIID